MNLDRRALLAQLRDEVETMPDEQFFKLLGYLQLLGEADEFSE